MTTSSHQKRIQQNWIWKFARIRLSILLELQEAIRRHDQARIDSIRERINLLDEEYIIPFITSCSCSANRKECTVIRRSLEMQVEMLKALSEVPHNQDKIIYLRSVLDWLDNYPLDECKDF